MLKLLSLTVAAGAMFALVAGNANALPSAPTAQAAVGSTLTLVRDDCGHGRHYSRSRGHCVRDQNDYRGQYRERHRNQYSEDCRRGWRFSQRRGHCVRIDSDNGANAIGSILSVIGGGHNQRGHHPGADGRDD